MEATQILCPGISKRMCVLISDLSGIEGPDSAHLPKVMACRWSFIYLDMSVLFYQERLLTEHNLDAWYCVCVGDMYVCTFTCLYGTVCPCVCVGGGQRLMASVYVDHFPFVY